MTLDHRRRLAWKAFRHTANYDGIISGWFGREILEESLPEEAGVPIRLQQPSATARIHTKAQPSMQSLDSVGGHSRG